MDFWKKYFNSCWSYYCDIFFCVVIWIMLFLFFLCGVEGMCFISKLLFCVFFLSLYWYNKKNNRFKWLLVSFDYICLLKNNFIEKKGGGVDRLWVVDIGIIFNLLFFKIRVK